MAKEIGGVLYLDAEESRRFMYNMIHPDEEVMQRRDEFFAEIDKLDIRRLDDGTVVLTSPDITLDEKEFDND